MFHYQLLIFCRPGVGDASGIAEAVGEGRPGSPELAITHFKESAEAATTLLSSLPTSHGVGIEDVPATYFSCFFNCLPGEEELRRGFSPTFTHARLPIAPAQEQKCGLVWARRILKMQTYAGNLLRCSDAAARKTLRAGIAKALGCHHRCTDELVEDTAYALALTANVGELPFQNSGGGRLGATAADIQDFDFAHARQKEREARCARVVQALERGAQIEQRDWAGLMTDRVVVAMVAQRSVAVATEARHHVSAEPILGAMLTVRPLPPVATLISRGRRRAPEATRIACEAVVESFSGVDTRRCISLLHACNATHFKRLLPAQAGPEGGCHWARGVGSE